VTPCARVAARVAARVGARVLTCLRVAFAGASTLFAPHVCVGLVVATAALVAPGSIHAEEVPFARQVELLIKVIPYDKNFTTRAPDVVRVALVGRSGADGAARAAAQISAALSGASIEGHAVEVSNEAFTSAAALAQTCKDRKLAVVYLLPGLSGDIGAIADALTGADVLSVAAEPELVPKRAVLGFDLVSGKPKILVHLPQARAQNVDFKSEVLKLMRVYE
jgi:hypothetical protein